MNIPSKNRAPRRRFLAAAAMAATGSPLPLTAQSGFIRGFDHVALPMQNTEAMMAFYRALGFRVDERPQICSVHVGDNMINFHRPELWQPGKFTLRAPAARPPCGDLCFVWEGTPASLEAMLSRAGAKVELGPAPRRGGRKGGSLEGSSVYVRDPDGNLLEFIIYS